MKALALRVREAWVDVDSTRVARIDLGLLALVGMEASDAEDQARWLAERLCTLRVFDDATGRMNLDLTRIGGSVLLVPNYTLAWDARLGRRPSFDGVMAPGPARALYEYLVAVLRQGGVSVAAAPFGARMRVGAVSDGPVSVILDSRPARP